MDEGGWTDDGHPLKLQFNYVETAVNNPYLDAIINMYLVSLGEFFSLDAYIGGYNGRSAFFMFLVATFMLLILFMNMIIAVMAEPFEEVKENKLSYQL